MYEKYEINNFILAVGHLPRLSYYFFYKTLQSYYFQFTQQLPIYQVLKSANSRPTTSLKIVLLNCDSTIFRRITSKNP